MERKFIYTISLPKPFNWSIDTTPPICGSPSELWISLRKQGNCFAIIKYMQEFTYNLFWGVENRGSVHGQASWYLGTYFFLPQLQQGLASLLKPYIVKSEALFMKTCLETLILTKDLLSGWICKDSNSLIFPRSTSSSSSQVLSS